MRMNVCELLLLLLSMLLLRMYKGYHAIDNLEQNKKPNQAP